MKKLLIIFALTFLLIGMIGTISALDLTPNVKSYNAGNQTLLVRDSIFWIFPTTNVLTATLDTPHDNLVNVGYQKVAEITVNPNQDYNNLISSFDFYNLKDGSKKIDRQVDIKYLAIEDVVVDDYSTQCSYKINENNTLSNVCVQVKSGSHIEQKQIWQEFNNSVKINQETIIGLFTNVEEGDKIEWIPQIAGVRVDEWAIWTADLNAGLDYYYNFENTTTVLWDVANTSGMNGTKFGAPANATGLIGSGNLFNNAYYNLSKGLADGSGSGTLNFWFNETDVVGNNFLMGQYGNNGNLWLRTIGGGLTGEFYVGGTANPINSSVSNLTNNVWHMGTVVWGVGGFQLWQDGVLVNSTTSTQDLLAKPFYIGGRENNVGGFDGNATNLKFDEIGIWNVRLNQTKIIQLYNGSKGITYPVAPVTSSVFSITLNNPTNNQILNTSSINFSTIPISSSNANGLNISIYGNWTGSWALNISNSTSLNNTQTNFSIANIPDGKYIWNALLQNGTNTAFASSNFTLTKDTTMPSVNITSPLNLTNYNYMVKSTNFTINSSTTDLNLNKCWVNYNNTNITFGCSTGGTSSIGINLTNQSTAIIYANDTFGSIGSSSLSWTYNLFDFNNYSYLPTISESSSAIINGQFQLGSPLSSAFLQYNNTNYSVSASSLGGNEYYLSSTAISPPVTLDTNVSWFFWINGMNTTLLNQTVLNANIDNCTLYTNRIFNFTILDEELLSSVSSTTSDYAINIYNIQRTAIVMSENRTILTNPFSICLQNPLSTNYSMDMTIKYHGTIPDYATRYYNFLNYTLSNTTTPINITLYDVNASNSLPFLLTFRDASLALSPNILVYVNKQYLATNDFKTVEIPKTDTNGQTILNLVRNNAIYNLIMVDIAGNIVSSFSNIVAFCQDYTIGSCSIDLSAAGSSQATYNYNTDVGISTSLSYTNSTSTLALAFNSLNSSTQTVRLEVITENQFENRSVCDTSISLVTGTLSCDLTNSLPTNQYFFANVYSGGQLIYTQSVNANPNSPTSGGSFGTDGYFIAFLLILVVILLFSDDKQTLMIMLGIGWVAIIALGLISGAIIGLTSGGIWLIITIIIFIWKLKQEETGQ